MQRVEVNQKNLHKGFRPMTFGGQLYQDHEDSIARIKSILKNVVKRSVHMSDAFRSSQN